MGAVLISGPESDIATGPPFVINMIQSLNPLGTPGLYTLVMLDALSVASGFAMAASPASLVMSNKSFLLKGDISKWRNHQDAANMSQSVNSSAVIEREPRFHIYDSGYCSVYHAWTPGDHGCAYVADVDVCTQAAKELNILGESTVRSYSPRPMFAGSPERGCLIDGAGEVSFARGYGNAACSKESRCICDCHVRHTRGRDQHGDLALPHPIETLALGTTSFAFIFAVYTSTHAPRLSAVLLSSPFPAALG